MLFNSFEFFVFFIVVVIAYYSIATRFRWILLLAASYFFYMSWQPGYAVLIAFTTLTSYWFGIKCETKDKKVRKFYFVLSLIINVGVLFFFKYFNFLNDSIRELLMQLSGRTYSFTGFDILLPVGISFYTFQTLSYNIDVYFGVKKPEKHLGIYSLYVIFFPQLIAGPIERSTDLLPQFHKENKFSFEEFHIGVKYMIWGFFKKIVIADRLSVIVNEVYNNTDRYGSSAYLFATFLFAFQLYCDFSAYSDIAKGAARILGFKLMENFNHPFKAKNITDFWRRWHISLSTWLRDYIYTPIVFSLKKRGKLAVAYSIFITFFICGLWHGAKLTFVLFGLIQGIALVYELYTTDFRRKISESVGAALYNPISVVLTFGFVLFSFIFFRAKTTDESYKMVASIFSNDYRFEDLLLLTTKFGNLRIALMLLIVAVFLFFDEKVFNLVKRFDSTKVIKEQALFALLVVMILLFGYFGEVEFIYFQF